VIADLHIHYPMHLEPGLSGKAFELLTDRRRQERKRDHARAQVVAWVGRFLSRETPWSGNRAELRQLRDGGVGVAFSVLYLPFAELDPLIKRNAPPERDYADDILRQLDLVEEDVRERHASEAMVCTTLADLDAAEREGKIAIVHCIEGGLFLGADAATVDDGVRRLAERGVAYVTLAHLLYRGVATCANAFPAFSDAAYGFLFRQPRIGLSELGRAAVRSMVERDVVIDVAHMSGRALDETFELLETLDPRREIPVIASHSAFRGRQKYNLDAATVARIAERGGVVGLILAEHQLLDGDRRRRTKDIGETLDVLDGQIRRLADAAGGSHAHIGIGSDLDGFIRPVAQGLQTAADLGALEQGLRARHPAVADDIASGNVMRVLRASWARRERGVGSGLG